MFTKTPRLNYCKQERSSSDLVFAFPDGPNLDVSESSYSSVSVDYWPSH